MQLERRPEWPSNACRDCVRALQSIAELKVKIHSSEEELKRVDPGPGLQVKTTTEDIPPDTLQKPIKDEFIKKEEEAQETAEYTVEEELCPDTITIEDASDGDYIEEEDEEFTGESPTIIYEIIDYPPSLLKEQFNTDGNKPPLITPTSTEPATPPPLRRQEKGKSKKAVAKAKKKEQRDRAHALMQELNILHCKDCLLEFETLVELNTHARQVHNKFSCSVTCCGQKYLFKDVFGHMIYHLDKTAFACKICGEMFSSKRLWRIHGQKAHQIGLKYECDQCDRKFNAQCTLDNHMLTHIPKEQRALSYACRKCDKSEFGGSFWV